MKCSVYGFSAFNISFDFIILYKPPNESMAAFISVAFLTLFPLATYCLILPRIWATFASQYDLPHWASLKSYLDIWMPEKYDKKLSNQSISLMTYEMDSIKLYQKSIMHDIVT